MAHYQLELQANPKKICRYISAFPTKSQITELSHVQNTFQQLFESQKIKAKAEFRKEGIFFLLQLFARDVLVMKKLEIEKTKPTFIISVLKVDIIKVGLVFSISNYFITKTPLANNWRRKKIPSCSFKSSKIVPS